ncbi:MAG TPA: hypothetical protein VN028_06865 [Rhodocyclaceae bacterium]|nr:hypothetical protein [Rhodocyclaceae bacterium]
MMPTARPLQPAQALPRARRQGAPRARQRQRGQAMIEYVVVLAFGVILLTQGSGSQKSAVEQLATAVRDYHKHYSYGMAIAYIPECDYSATAFDPSTDDSFIATLTGGVTVSGDRCIDWQNPEIPIPSISLGNLTDMPTADGIEGAIKKIITDMLDNALDQFLNPGALFTDGLQFNISDFF